MSAAASQVAILGPRGSVNDSSAVARTGRSLGRLTAFGGLALYGTLKWSTLLTGHPLGRLLGLFVLAMLLAAGRPLLSRYSRLLAALATVAVLIAAFPVAGVPLSWVWHVRIAVTANAIGDGLSALPQVLVPYSGVNQWVDLVMMLGAAVLLFDGALLMAFSPGPMSSLRRAGAALPLVALAAVPTTLVRPQLPYLDGAILFALLVAFMWGEEIGSRRAGGALGISAIAVIAALFLAPAIERHKPWFNYRALAGGLGPKSVDAFDWTQGYGRIDWPRSGRVVLEIQAAHPDYWKAENLDVFNGTGWVDQPVRGRTPSPDPSAVRRWTQTIQVTIGDMRTSDVIGAGDSTQALDVPESLNPGVTAGTFTTAAPLNPGDAYRVSTYEPAPSPKALAATGASYAALSQAYRTIELPPSRGAPSPAENYYPVQVPNGKNKVAKGYQAQLVFPAFHSGGPITTIGGPKGVAAVPLLRSSSPVRHHTLADAYNVAQSLAAGSATPYRFVEAVENYLGHGFTYNETPPPSAYPLVSFLFSSHLGYCQQFAGAMALLLRMGGVPARVAVGFTPGHDDRATGRWLVTDYDAHAWVEVWFPHYGWVRFDPTPPAKDPAQSGRSPLATGSGTNSAASGAGLSASKTVRGTNTGNRRIPSAAGQARSKHGGGSSVVPWIVAALALLMLVAAGIATKPLSSADELVAELETALKKLGRPLAGGATLAGLERRVAGSGQAAAYVRALRVARFSNSDRLPTRAQRRALRRQLRRGLGPFRVLRSLWALPPRWGRPRSPGLDRGQTHAPHPSGA